MSEWPTRYDEQGWPVQFGGKTKEEWAKIPGSFAAPKEAVQVDCDIPNCSACQAQEIEDLTAQIAALTAEREALQGEADRWQNSFKRTSKFKREMQDRNEYLEACLVKARAFMSDAEWDEHIAAVGQREFVDHLEAETKEVVRLKMALAHLKQVNTQAAERWSRAEGRIREAERVLNVTIDGLCPCESCGNAPDWSAAVHQALAALAPAEPDKSQKDLPVAAPEND